MDQTAHSKQADNGQRAAGVQRPVRGEVMTTELRQRNETIRQEERERGEYALPQFRSLNAKATGMDL